MLKLGAAMGVALWWSVMSVPLSCPSQLPSKVVARAVEVVGGRPVVEILLRTVGTGNEVVVHHVLIVVGSRVSADDAHAIVIHHIIIILQVALHLRVAALVVGPQAVVDGPVACAVGDGAEALRLDAL